MTARGLWNMVCWNGLSIQQRDRLMTVGNLPFGTVAQGTCPNAAEVGIETSDDRKPGAPRFYCLSCAIEYLTLLKERKEDDQVHPED